MNYKQKKSVRVLQGASAEELEAKMCEVLENASNPKISVDLANLRAYIEFVEDVAVAETLAEKYELEGCCHTCSECPYLQTFADKRKKPRCIVNGFRVSPKSSVCDYYFRAMERRGHADNQTSERECGAHEMGGFEPVRG